MKNITSSILYQNNHIDIVHDACKLCYNGKSEDGMEKKLKYIENKVKLGHESVLEHSNIIILTTCKNSNKPNVSTNNHVEYIEVLEAGRYLNSRTRMTEDGTIHYILGGNIRAFKNIFRNIKNSNNSIAKSILESLYDLPREYMYDFIEAGLMSYNRFRFNDVIYKDMTYNNSIESENLKSYKIVNMDKLDYIAYILSLYTDTLFDYDDILDMGTVTIYFNEVSRIITQQITRHRNAISQLSQRYVDESDAVSNNPLKFSKKLPEDTKFKLTEFSSYEGTLDEISDGLNSIYRDLRKQGMTKEDARYFLPQNVQSSLYVTFTFRSLLYFLKVRMEDAAQAEIRNIARDMLYHIEPEVVNYLGEDLFKYIIPKYLLTEVDYDLSLLEEPTEKDI